MNEPKNDYSAYTLGQLQDALRWVDRNRYPDRAATIERQIVRRREEIARQPRPETAGTGTAGQAERWRKALTRRTAAFLVDFLFFLILWSALEILVFSRSSRIHHILFTFLAFILYFLIWEGLFPRKASPGKRLAGLSVVQWDGSGATVVNILLRSILFGSLSVLAWDQLVHLAIRGESAFWILLAAVVLLRGESLFNLFLAIRDPHGRMLQDRMTRTLVIDAWSAIPGEKFPGREPRDGRSTRWVPSPLVLLIFVLGFGGIYAMVQFRPIPSIGGESWSILAPIETERLDGADRIQEQLDRQLSLVTRVSIASRNRKTTDRESRILTVSVWLSPFKWSPQNRDRVREAVILPDGLDLDSFDEGVLKIWTGTRFFRYSRTFPLELPGP